MIEFISTLNPAWIWMVFPLLFVAVLVSVVRDARRQKKREAMHHTMTPEQYRNFNNERFHN